MRQTSRITAAGWRENHCQPCCGEIQHLSIVGNASLLSPSGPHSAPAAGSLMMPTNRGYKCMSSQPVGDPIHLAQPTTCISSSHIVILFLSQFFIDCLYQKFATHGNSHRSCGYHKIPKGMGMIPSHVHMEMEIKFQECECHCHRHFPCKSLSTSDILFLHSGSF